MSCPGSSRISGVRTWYVPKGMTPQECTYCTYCYEHKCMNMDTLDVRAVQSEVNSRVNCDCTAHKFKYDPLVCVSCRNNMRIVPADISECHNCGGYVHSSGLKYCNQCTHTLQACVFCGEHVTPEPPKPEEPKPEEPKLEEPKPEEQSEGQSEDEVEDLVQCQLL